jgi:hypothetical protein
MEGPIEAPGEGDGLFEGPGDADGLGEGVAVGEGEGVGVGVDVGQPSFGRSVQAPQTDPEQVWVPAQPSVVVHDCV